jgi:integrase/recombinase XerD
MAASTSLFIDRYHPKADGKCAISIRVTFERKKRYYKIDRAATVTDFEKSQGEKPRAEFKELAKLLNEYENKAIDIIKMLPEFTFTAFEKKYFTNRGAKDIVKIAYDEKIKELTENGQIGTAVSYSCSQKSINKFSPDIKFKEVTPKFLKEYENYMIAEGNSKTTISLYLRTLRSLFNHAINNGDILPELYPFKAKGNNKYEIPEGSNTKKALEATDIELIFNYEATKGSVKEMAKDFWIFIYFTNGLNVKDLCLLKYKNIEGDTIKFIRAKTKNQKKEKQIIAILQPETIAIIEKWGNSKRDGFIFPILNGKETPTRERQLIQQLTHVINDNMKSIAAELNITCNVCTYSARHSFSTALKRSGVSTEVISEMLGHSSLNTTKLYLASFKEETIKVAASSLRPGVKTQD